MQDGALFQVTSQFTLLNRVGIKVGRIIPETGDPSQYFYCLDFGREVLNSLFAEGRITEDERAGLDSQISCSGMVEDIPGVLDKIMHVDLPDDLSMNGLAFKPCANEDCLFTADDGFAHGRITRWDAVIDQDYIVTTVVEALCLLSAGVDKEFCTADQAIALIQQMGNAGMSSTREELIYRLETLPQERQETIDQQYKMRAAVQMLERFGGQVIYDDGNSTVVSVSISPEIEELLNSLLEGRRPPEDYH